MTHESLANGEHHAGPEHDHTLPDADRIPGDLTPEESDMPVLDEDF